MVPKARQALGCAEVAVGCVIVLDDSTVLAAGSNETNMTKNVDPQKAVVLFSSFEDLISRRRDMPSWWRLTACYSRVSFRSNAPIPQRLSAFLNVARSM